MSYPYSRPTFLQESFELPFLALPAQVATLLFLEQTGNVLYTSNAQQREFVMSGGVHIECNNRGVPLAQFDGVDGAIIATDALWQNFPAGFTIMTAVSLSSGAVFDKRGGNNERAYRVTYQDGNTRFLFGISGDGTTESANNTGDGSVPLDTPTFCALRFKPNDEVKCWANDTTQDITTTITTIFDSPVDLGLGVATDGGNSNHMDGWMAFYVMCAAPLHDDHVDYFYKHCIKWGIAT